MSQGRSGLGIRLGVRQKTQGQRVGLWWGGWRSWLLLGPCLGELGTSWGKCPGVGPIAPADLSGGWCPGLGRTGNPGLAGLVLGPGPPPGRQLPLPAGSCKCAGRPGCSGGCCSHLRIPLHTSMATGQAWAGQNCSPVSSCLLAHLPKQGISEGFRPQFPPWLLLMEHPLGPFYPRPLRSGRLPQDAPQSRRASPAFLRPEHVPCGRNRCEPCLPALAPACRPLLHPCTVPA